MTSIHGTEPRPDQHGTRYCYTYFRCRCQPCRIANTVYQSRRVAARTLRVTEVPHGTAGGYSNWGCRCRSCKAAHQVEMTSLRHKLAARRYELRRTGIRDLPGYLQMTVCRGLRVDGTRCERKLSDAVRCWQHAD